MAQLNNITVVPRWERPSAADDVYLEMYYMKSGAMTDVFALSSVYVFHDTTNGDSSVWLNSTGTSPHFGTVESTKYKDAKMVFNNLQLVDWDQTTRSVLQVTDPNQPEFDTTNFKESTETDNSASGIFRISEGHYGVVLRPSTNFWNFDQIPKTDETGNTIDITAVSSNTASSVTSYFDVWTVQDAQDDKPRTIIHSFTLYGAGFSNIVSLTEPIIVNTRHTLVQKYVNRGSLEKLQIKTDYVVINRNIGQDIKNIFKDGILEGAAIRIIKLSDRVSTGLPFELIKDWADTKPAILTDSADTILYNWETSGLETGTYQVQVSSTVLDNRIMSDPFHVILR